MRSAPKRSPARTPFVLLLKAPDHSRDKKKGTSDSDVAFSGKVLVDFRRVVRLVVQEKLERVVSHHKMSKPSKGSVRSLKPMLPGRNNRKIPKWDGEESLDLPKTNPCRSNRPPLAFLYPERVTGKNASYVHVRAYLFGLLASRAEQVFCSIRSYGRNFPTPSRFFLIEETISFKKLN